MARGPKVSTKIKREPKSPAQRVAEAVAAKAEAIGAPAVQVARGMHAIVDVPLRDGGRVVTTQTLINRGGTPVARWKAAKLLSDSQVAAIDHCERLWSRHDVRWQAIGYRGSDHDRTGGCERRERRARDRDHRSVDVLH